MLYKASFWVVLSKHIHNSAKPSVPCNLLDESDHAFMLINHYTQRQFCDVTFEKRS